MSFRRRPSKRTMRRTKKGAPIRTIVRQETKRVLRRELEVKQYDGAIAQTSADYSGTGWPQSLTASPLAGTVITQGTGNTQYIGGKINPVLMQVDLVWETQSTSYNSVRTVIVQVRGSTAPTAAQLLASVGNIRTPLSPYDINQRSRYTVLYDKRMTINNNNGTGQSARQLNIRIPKRKLRPITFNNASGGNEDGGLFIYLYGDEPGASTPPNALYYSRLYFHDA